MLYNRSVMRTNTETDRKQQTEAVRDFVRLGGVTLLRRILSITDEELNATYVQNTSTASSSSSLFGDVAGARPGAPPGRDEDNFILFLAQLIGWGLDTAAQHENLRRQRQEEEQRDEQRRQRQQQASQLRRTVHFDDEDEDLYNSDEDEGESDAEEMDDPPLEPFSREAQEDRKLDENDEEYDSDPEEDVYRPTSQDETGIVHLTPASRILERLINHPRYTAWLKNSMFKYCVMLLRESAFVVQSQSDLIVQSRRDLDLLFSFLLDQNLFFTVTPLLEEATAFHLGTCPISSIGLLTDIFLFNSSCIEPLTSCVKQILSLKMLEVTLH